MKLSTSSFAKTIKASKFIKGILATAILSVSAGLVSVPSANAAGAGSCIKGDVCYKNYQQGNYVYGFGYSDDNLHNNKFNNGYTVGDNVQKGRNRNNIYKFMCIYGDTNRRGYREVVPYDNAEWVSISKGASSHKISKSSNCS